MATSCEGLRVVVRVRPPTLPISASSPLLQSNFSSSFPSFVFLPSASTQHDLYSSIGGDEIIRSLLVDGANGCVFAYGASGSGKTHSMLGGRSGRRCFPHLQDGLIPQLADSLWRHIARLQADALTEFDVRATWLEIYADRVYDLLSEEDPTNASLPTIKNLPDDPRPGMVPLPIRGGDLSSSSSPSSVYAAGALSLPVTTTASLLSLIARGSAKRVTRATGVHDDSSRSHALLTLTVRRRWQKSPPSQPQHPPSAATTLERSATLLLADLAGSESMDRAHAGRKDRAGSSVNVGLLVLGRVLEALAKNGGGGGGRRNAGGAVVPFRDSPLTRLMAPALSGNCKTLLLATLSPDSADAAETAATLKFASRANSLSTQVSAAPSTEYIDPIPDPMKNDVPDTNPSLCRRTVFITTARFGDVHARVTGDPSAPLILYVHGSGPTNSSLQWNFLVPKLELELARRSRLRSSSSSSSVSSSFYHVAIDCPGYGQSPGDRQAIRSYPSALIRAVVTGLGKTIAFALVGSSQGACAVFNAILADSELAHYLAVCNPVGHDVKRYVAIEQPTLLAFDTEDEGHPVSVGRRMQQYLPNPHYHEFSFSKSPTWLDDNFAERISDMFAAYAKPRNSRGNATLRLPDLTRLAGGLCKWATPGANECKEYAVDVPELSADGGLHTSRRSDCAPVVEEEREERESPPSEVDPDSASNRAINKNRSTKNNGVRRAGVVDDRLVTNLRTSTRRPRNTHTPSSFNLSSSANLPKISTQESAILLSSEDEEEEEEERVFGDSGFESDDSHDAPLTEHGRRRAAAAALVAAAVDAEASLQQSSCSRCEKLLISPQQLSPCGHFQCGPCSLRFGKLHRRCADCGQSVRTCDSVSPALVARLQLRMASGEFPSSEIEEQERLYASVERQLSSNSIVIIEFGNTANPPGPHDPRVRRSMSTFVRAAGGSSRLLDHVAFDINPGSGATAVRISKPNGCANAFVLERSMTRSFPCFLRLTFTAHSGIPPIVIEYFTQHEYHNSSRRLVICGVPAQTAPRRFPQRKKSKLDRVVVDPGAQSASDVFLEWDGNGKPTISLNRKSMQTSEVR